MPGLSGIDDRSRSDQHQLRPWEDTRVVLDAAETFFITWDEDLLRVLIRRWAERYPGWAYDEWDGTFWHDGGGLG